MSWVTSLVGGGPGKYGTLGAPLGSLPFIATHGLPLADASAAAVVLVELSAFEFAFGGEETSTLLLSFDWIANAPRSGPR